MSTKKTAPKKAPRRVKKAPRKITKRGSGTGDRDVRGSKSKSKRS